MPTTTDHPLKMLRQARGLAQYGLAALAHVSPSTILAAEKRGYVPSSPVRERLARALGASPRDIWPDEHVEAHQ
jgi:DNA-binding XRE family transcriptional regulator